MVSASGPRHSGLRTSARHISFFLFGLVSVHTLPITFTYSSIIAMGLKFGYRNCSKFYQRSTIFKYGPKTGSFYIQEMLIHTYIRPFHLMLYSASTDHLVVHCLNFMLHYATVSVSSHYTLCIFFLMGHVCLSLFVARLLPAVQQIIIFNYYLFIYTPFLTPFFFFFRIDIF